MFQAIFTVRLYDTDAAGVLYFGNQFRFAHDAFEQFLSHINIDIQNLFKKEPFHFVIVHAESDYKVPLFVGDTLRTELVVTHLGNTSFEISYSFFKNDQLAGTAKTVHVCIDREKRTKRLLPDSIRQKLRHYSNT